MITNERQYRITKAQLDTLKKAVESFNFDEALKAVKSPRLAKAQIEAMQSECDALSIQLQEYDTLRSGGVEILKASTLEELPNILISARIAKGFSQKDLADRMGLKEQQIQRYEADEYAQATLIRLGEVAKALNINIREIAEFGKLEEVSKINQDDFEWDRFPIKEMYKRGWLVDFSGSLYEAVENSEELVKDFLSDIPEPLCAAAHQRVRLGGNVNRYALLAWQAQVIKLSRLKKIKKKFNKNILSDEWLKKLAKFSSQEEAGILYAVEYLKEAGIPLVVEPHLNNTYLDGAAFLLSDGPIIGMTIRYDRIDNFWFVLLHELIHVKEHLHKGKIESIFDDLEVKADKLEKEADEGASEILIPSKKWETALVRYIQNKDSIEDFAKELGISPAIIAGKIRREAGNYIILSDMVGQGRVRRQFIEIDFST